MKQEVSRLSSYLEHILEAISNIEEYTDDMIDLVFLENKLVQDAVIRNVEIIGEAAKNILMRFPEFTQEHYEVPWNDLYGMRNRVSHGYFTVDLELVWRTVENDLPRLEKKIKKLLAALPK